MTPRQMYGHHVSLALLCPGGRDAALRADSAAHDAWLAGRDLSLSARGFATADDASDPFAPTVAAVLAYNDARRTA